MVAFHKSSVLNKMFYHYTIWSLKTRICRSTDVGPFNPAGYEKEKWTLKLCAEWEESGGCSTHSPLRGILL